MLTLAGAITRRIQGAVRAVDALLATGSIENARHAAALSRSRRRAFAALVLGQPDRDPARRSA